MIIDAQLWWRLPQKIRFLVAGGYNTLFGYLVFALLFLLAGRRVHYLVIGAFAHVIALTSGFMVYRWLVFLSRNVWYQAFARFFVSQLATFGAGIAGLYGLVAFGHFQPLLAQAVVTCLSVILTYTLHRHYSFRDRPEEIQ